MNYNSAIEELAREARFLKVIAKIAPDIPAQELWKHLAPQARVFRGRKPEKLEQFAKQGYFAESTEEHRDREFDYAESSVIRAAARLTANMTARPKTLILLHNVPRPHYPGSPAPIKNEDGYYVLTIPQA
jgi:hypothetical protein